MSVWVCGRAGVRAFGRACVREYVRAFVGACLRVCVCVRACVTRVSPFLLQFFQTN